VASDRGARRFAPLPVELDEQVGRPVDDARLVVAGAEFTKPVRWIAVSNRSRSPSAYFTADSVWTSAQRAASPFLDREPAAQQTRRYGSSSRIGTVRTGRGAPTARCDTNRARSVLR
jgi:hypothetical protein